MKGVNIGEVNINNLRYADETVLLAEGPMFSTIFTNRCQCKRETIWHGNEHNQNKINDDEQEKAHA